MSNTSYVIVGGGMTAAAAVHGIREIDPEGSIALISAEPDPPYKRPPLSKGLWNGKPFERIWSGTDKLDVNLHLGRTVREIDLGGKSLVDDQGTTYQFDKLLLATGSSPRRLPFESNRIIHFRTLQDYRRLRALTDKWQRFAVIGGGFIGSEIAAALASNGKAVSMIFPGFAIGDSLFPRDLALALNERYRQQGVEVLAGETVVGMDSQRNGVILRLRQVGNGGEREITVDGVVAGIGTVPNVDLARSSGLAVDNGIVVDEYLRTTHPDIFAAGDVANFRVAALGERRRFEHEDNALTMGRHAGRAMAGEIDSYDHLPFFYSDLFDMGYEAVGDLDARLDTVADWTVPFREGVVYYLREGRVRGMLMWNVWDQVESARRLIAQPWPFVRKDLIGQLQKTA